LGTRREALGLFRGPRSRLCAEIRRKSRNSVQPQRFGKFLRRCQFCRTGCMEEAVARSHILQSLAFHLPGLYDITRRMHSSPCSDWRVQHPRHALILRPSTAAPSSSRTAIVAVRPGANEYRCAYRPVERGNRANTNFQEVAASREPGWGVHDLETKTNRWGKE